MDFVAIDFETATYQPSSACAVGIVTVENSEIVEEYYSLIQPPDNEYCVQNIRVHSIIPQDTWNAPDFYDLYPEIKKRLAGKTIVAHNESFDRNVLKKSMEYYQLDYDELELPYRWHCTVKIYKKLEALPANLKACCARHNIELNHHEALSDARACAKLFLKAKSPLFYSI